MIEVVIIVKTMIIATVIMCHSVIMIISDNNIGHVNNGHGDNVIVITIVINITIVMSEPNNSYELWAVVLSGLTLYCQCPCTLWTLCYLQRSSGGRELHCAWGLDDT